MFARFDDGCHLRRRFVPPIRVVDVLRPFVGFVRIDRPQFGGHVVWGFTAMLLSGIFESVGWEQPWDQTHIFEVSR